MVATGSVLTDAARLAEVARYTRYDASLITQLDQIAADTVAWTGMPIALVTLLTADVQRCLGLHGLPDSVTLGGHTISRFDVPVALAFCAPMIDSGHSHVIPDMQQDPQYADNPLVTQLGIRSYVGIPLISPTGHVLGGHCVLSPDAHQLSVCDILALELGAAKAVTALTVSSMATL